MAFVINDRVKETTTTTGQGTLNLAGASQDFISFVSGVGTTNSTFTLLLIQEQENLKLVLVQ